MSYFTLLPIEEGGTTEAGRYYEYNGTFIAPLDSVIVSMTVGYGQHVWVDYIKAEMLHDGGCPSPSSPTKQPQPYAEP